MLQGTWTPAALVLPPQLWVGAQPSSQCRANTYRSAERSGACPWLGQLLPGRRARRGPAGTGWSAAGSRDLPAAPQSHAPSCQGTHTPQTADTPPCAPTPAPPAGVTPVQGNMLKCSQRAAVILLCHPDSEAPGIDAVLQNLLRLQPSGQCLSLGCCRVAEASSAALGHSTSREMLCRASHQGLGPS